MSTFKARGLVLKEINVGESDKIITLLLKEYGKISVSAKGARKTNSKFLSAAQLFTYSDFVIFQGSGFYSIASAEPIESFFSLRQDYDRLCIGAYFLELTDKTVFDGQVTDDILYLNIKALNALNKGAGGQVSPELIRIAYDFKFLQLNGYAPEIYACSSCGSPFDEREAVRFGGYGVICSRCLKTAQPEGGPYTVSISAPALYAITYILEQDIKSLFTFTTDYKTILELKAASGIFFNTHIDVKLNSREFLD